MNSTRMKYQTKLALITGIALIYSLPALSRDVFRLSWRGTAFTTNRFGKVTARPYSQREILDKYIADTGQDPRGLTIGYVHDEEEPAEEVEIVNAADGSTVANVFQFLGGLAVTSNDGTQTRRQRFIFDEAHESALGDISGAERLRRNVEGRIISFAYSGRFQFSIPEENTVVIGSFVTGKRLE